MSILKGIVPTKIIPGKWWEQQKIDDPRTLRPQPQRDVLLIVGDATGVMDDLSAFLDFGVPFDTLAINYAVRVIPWTIQHFCAGDSHMKDMQAIAQGLNGHTIKHCWNPNSDGFDIRWVRNSHSGWNGTTANLAIKIGVAIGYPRMVLAGVPMDNSGNWYKPYLPEKDIKRLKDHRAHLWKWAEIATRPVARLIRSMSGNTRDMLGEPTKEWLLMQPERSQDGNS